MRFLYQLFTYIIYKLLVGKDLHDMEDPDDL